MLTNLSIYDYIGGKSEELQFPDIFQNSDLPPIFESPRGKLFQVDCLELLKSIKDGSVNVIFADPPYNIKKAHWDTFESEETYLDWMKSWITECHRILANNGSLFVMGFSESLADIKVLIAKDLFPNIRWLIWHYRNKPNLSNKDWVRSHEAILHLRKQKNFYFDSDAIRDPYNKHTRTYPERAQGKSSQFGTKATKKKIHDDPVTWAPIKHGAKPRDVIDIPALNNGMKESTNHPTQKPEALLRKLLMGTSRPLDIILDPFGGSGTTFIVAEQLTRFWIGSEILNEYVGIIKKRVTTYLKDPKPIEYWLQLDRKREQHRAKIRGK